MKKNKIYLGLVLIGGLLLISNFSKSREIGRSDLTKAQVGWALSKYVGNYESGGAAEVVSIAGWGALGGYGGAKLGASIGMIGGPAGGVLGAIGGAL